MEYQQKDRADGRLIGRFNARLQGPLEQRFVSETDADRDRQIAFWVACNLCLSWLTLAIDLVTMPELWRLALLSRVFIDTPVSLVAIRVLTTSQPRWQRSVAAIAPPSILILRLIFLFGVSAHPDPFRSAIVLSLGVLWINVIVPMRLLDALVCTVATTALGDIINTGMATLQHLPFAHVDVVITAHVLVGFSLVSRLLAERQSRLSFLLGLRLRIRAEDLARSNAQLLKMSNTDPLTGLANRRSFDLALKQAFQNAAATQSALAVMMIDVDHFKQFNDTAGHLEGDRCLTVIARTIADQLFGVRDLAARFGGEEFVVLMPGADLAKGQEIAMRIHTAISAMRVFHPARAGCGFVSVSIGVAGTDGGPAIATAAALVAAADEAMYAAKKAGRDRVECGGRAKVGASA